MSPTLDEAMERRVVDGKDKPGKLVGIGGGDPAKGTTVTIHGINGSPEDVRPFTDLAMSKGQHVMTYMYDDQYRRLEDSSRDLAAELSQWVTNNPARPLRIDAHSMGGRVVLGALKQLMDEHKMPARLDLNLVAPPLAGYGSANGARMAPGFIGRLIAGVEPGRDMGTTSGFQQMLAALRLPSSVTVRVFIGTADDVVDGKDPVFEQMVHNLGASLTRLNGADHVTAVAQAAALTPN